MSIEKHHLKLQEAHLLSDFEHAVRKGDFEEALAMIMKRGVIQNRQLYRIDAEQKITVANEVAKKVKNYADSFQGYGLNKSTFINVLQIGSGMFGLVGVSQPQLFGRLMTIPKPEFFLQTSQIASQVIGSFKGSIDEGTQGKRIIDQNAIESLKRLQEELKERTQKHQQSTAELIRQLQTLLQQMHEGKTRVNM